MHLRVYMYKMKRWFGKLVYVLDTIYCVINEAINNAINELRCRFVNHLVSQSMHD